MPHLRLEYSANVAPDGSCEDLFGECHRILHQQGGIRIANCKSRAYAVERYLVGEGDAHDAFVHLDVRLLAGRSAELKASLGEALLAALRAGFAGACEQRAVQITVELRDIDRGGYHKHPAGTFTPL